MINRFTQQSDEDIDGNLHFWIIEDPEGEYVLYNDHLQFVNELSNEKLINNTAIRLLQDYILHGDSGRFYDRVKSFMKDHGYDPDS